MDPCFIPDLKDSLQTVTSHNTHRPIHPMFQDLPEDHNEAITILCTKLQEASDQETKTLIINEIMLRVFFLLPYHAKKHAGKLFLKLPHSVFEDAIQNMCLNVLTAINKFDPSRGTKFSDYLLMYLKNGLYKAIKQNNVIAQTTAPQESEEPFNYLEHYNSNVLSGAESVVMGCVEFSDGTVAAVDSSYYQEEIDSIESLHEREVNAWLHFALDPNNGVLTEDESLTLKHHFGLFGCTKLRLKDIAYIRKQKGKGCATTRIFQIEKEAMRKLKAYFKKIGLM